jgi:hypothetical protein
MIDVPRPEFTMELCCCEMVLLNDIGIKEFTHKQIAQTYRLALQSSESKTIDWKKVNEAIIARWSKAGLERIKKLAWSGKCFST